jgi:hypothetical protein
MIPKHIIEKAIAGGWHKDWKLTVKGLDVADFLVGNILQFRTTDDRCKINIPIFEIALDPDFWVALGKEMGWNKETHGGKTFIDWQGDVYETVYNWQYRALRFYDFILRKASQEEIEAFWKSF